MTTLSRFRHRLSYSGIYCHGAGHRLEYLTRCGELVCIIVGKGCVNQAYHVIVRYLREGVLDPEEACELNVAVNTIAEMTDTCRMGGVGK